MSDLDRGPTEKRGHVTVTRRGVQYCALPGDDEGPYPPILIENNSPQPAKMTFRGETFIVPPYSTVTYK